jgi:uncharacterized protein YdeI (YjbR/CyaY-like superfamily)
MTAGKPLRPDYPELTVRSRAAWRRWLQKHHSSSRGVWFVHFRKESGEKSVAYDDLVEEALCFGWIDTSTGLPMPSAMTRERAAWPRRCGC